MLKISTKQGDLEVVIDCEDAAEFVADCSIIFENLLSLVCSAPKFMEEPSECVLAAILDGASIAIVRALYKKNRTGGRP